MTHLIKQAEFISAPQSIGQRVPCFARALDLKGDIARATLHISALGLYEAAIDGQRVGKFLFAPGWTEYASRLQFQTYDVTGLLKPDSLLTVMVGEGWWGGRMGWDGQKERNRTALIAALEVEFTDGRTQTVLTDARWQVLTTPILRSSIYDGETVDMTAETESLGYAEVVDYDKSILLPQEGEEVHEMATLGVIAEITTPAGERVLDFGQNLTGYVRVHAHGGKGDEIELSFAEVLDKDGNFYTENMRSAKNKIRYILADSEPMDFAPTFCWQGFRYVRLDKCSAGMTADDFTAVAVHSDIERTGDFDCGVPLVNQLYQNILWGQRGNFLDVPTDCPQRDERLGWTGDAQVFARTASYNFKVDKFFRKWLHDLNASQDAQGRIPHVIPNILGPNSAGSAAWGDVATIVPWEMYLTYGDKQFLTDQFDSAKKWVDYIHAAGSEEYLWLDGEHFGDWLGLDAPEGSYKGSTDESLIASAFFAHSTRNLIRMGDALGKDMGAYRDLYTHIIDAWRRRYIASPGRLICDTQTAYVLALAFDLVGKKQPFADRLAEKIHENGDKLQTGFVGTPYLLRALSENSYTDLAYTLLLQTEFPSWLYPVTRGATTMWEHWDGLKPDGSMWSADMNSFNHYAYGAVGAWMFNTAAGINPDPENPGFRRILFLPQPDARLGHVTASIRTAHGTVAAHWHYEGDQVRYTFTVPKGCTARVDFGDRVAELTEGTHRF
ncbi:MAG: family 78 glycoside hydrolase catalytic domain [Candidatus Spyradocola sp.]